MQARLIIRKGPRKGEECLIDEGQKVIVGRSVQANFQLLDEGLSRAHAAVENRGTYCEIADLQSSNGTFLNGKKIKTAVLRTGDVIKMGDAFLEFEMGEKEPSSGDSTIRILDMPQTKALNAAGGTRKRYDMQKPLELAQTHPEDVKSTQQAMRRLGALARISTLIHAQTDLQKLFMAVIDAVMEEVPADRGFLVLLGDNQQFQPMAIRTKKPEPGEIVLSHSVLQEAVRNGNSVLTTDASLDERFQTGASILIHNIHSVMCVPLMTYDRRIVGALYFDTIAEGKPFGDADLEFITAIGCQAGTAIERQRLTGDLEEMMFSMVRSLVAAIEAKDEYTSGHSERVMAYSLLLAREMGWNESQLEDLRLAGLLHDVGKIGVPESILTSAKALSEDEWRVMRGHPEMSLRILSQIKSPRIQIAVDAAMYHHEKIDGSGYPRGLKGDQIPLVARIIAVADAYDAMTSNRRYRTNFNDDHASEEFKRCAGSHFDRDVVKAFLSLSARKAILPMLAIGEDMHRNLKLT